MGVIRQNGGEDWGPWVIHNGKGCPLPSGTVVEVVSEDGFGFAKREIGAVTGGSYSSGSWQHYPELKRIIRYRAKRPKGLLMLEEKLRELYAPTPKPVAPVDQKAL